MKIKIIAAKPVPTPPPTLEVTFDEAEVRFIHKILGKFSTPALIEHLDLGGSRYSSGSQLVERETQLKLFDKIFDELKPVIGTFSDEPVTLSKK